MLSVVRRAIFYPKFLLLQSLFLFNTTAFAADDCGDITIAEMTWNSAALIANIDSFILSEGYGCNVELVPGDTMATGTSLVEKGEPDIAPELWTNSMFELIQQAVADKRVRLAGKSLSDGGE